MQNKKLVSAKNIVIVATILFFASCNSDKKEEQDVEVKKEIVKAVKGTYSVETMVAEIAKIEKELDKSSTPNKNELRIRLVEFYESFFNLFSNDKLAADMLFKAGNQSVNLEKYQDALKYYSLAEESYPEYIKRPECIYLQGFIFDTYVSELGKAKEKYLLLINRYPKHVLAEQAQISLDNLGKSDEDLIRQFEKQNKN